MDICLFLVGHSDDGRGAPHEPAASLIASAAQQVQGLRSFVTHCRMESPAGGSTPDCVLQCYFDDLDRLESALERDGAIETLLDQLVIAAPGHCTFVQQVMAVRKFATPTAGHSPCSSQRCTYLVSYEGEAQDLNAWLTHYMSCHPPLMSQLPGIRELEIYTRVDYRTGLAIPRSTAMQRNKVVFDDPGALAAALASPVRERMRADFDAFPPYSGTAPHYPMRSIYGNLERS